MDSLEAHRRGRALGVAGGLVAWGPGASRFAQAGLGAHGALPWTCATPPRPFSQRKRSRRVLLLLLRCPQEAPRDVGAAGFQNGQRLWAAPADPGLLPEQSMSAALPWGARLCPGQPASGERPFLFLFQPPDQEHHTYLHIVTYLHMHIKLHSCLCFATLLACWLFMLLLNIRIPQLAAAAATRCSRLLLVRHGPARRPCSLRALFLRGAHTRTLAPGGVETQGSACMNNPLLVSDV